VNKRKGREYLNKNLCLGNHRNYESDKIEKVLANSKKKSSIEGCWSDKKKFKGGDLEKENK